MHENSRPNIFRCDMNYVPMEESQKVHNNSSQIESLRTSLNAIYNDVIKNVESAQIKFPLKSKARENVCSRDNLLSPMVVARLGRFCAFTKTMGYLDIKLPRINLQG